MGRRSKYSIEQKVDAVLNYQGGKLSGSLICQSLGIAYTTLIKWKALFEDFGEEGFCHKSRNKSYSNELKELAVNDYLSGKGSYLDIARKYEITSESILVGWVSKYNGYEVLKEYNPKGEVYMTKSRKTSIDVRIEIVRYCIDHNCEYKLAAEHFNVSYAQVYQWVKKYKEQGELGLEDGRGKRKSEGELSELEKLQRENSLLRNKLELQERENILLKKVKEIERRRFSPKGNKNQNT